jgi:hypothetical protein
MDSFLATKANLSGATFTGGVIAPSLSATTLSGGTIYSGGTDLSSIFALAGSDVTTASNGLTKTGNNITLGGTLTGDTTITQGSNYINFDGDVGIGGAPSTNLDVAGNMRLTGSLSAATISGAIYSAGTDLYDIFITDPGVTGSGTNNTIPMWNGSTTLTDSIMTFRYWEQQQQLIPMTFM